MHLGIDLGTSNSAIVGHTGSSLRLFKTADGTDVLPSAIFQDTRGRQFVGRRAYEQAAIAPDSVAREFKRLMGTSTPLSLGSAVTITPEQASGEILRTLLAQALSESGFQTVKGTVIAIPAAFNQMQTEATIAAADLASITPVGLLHEPIAAALASMANSPVKTGQFLVYDFGGGTFDVALVQSSGGTVNVIAHEGVNMLGGKDFDQLMVAELICPWLESNFDLPANYRTDPIFATILKRVRLKVEQAKIELSTRETTSVFLGDDEIRAKDRSGKELFVDLEVSRKQLEEYIYPHIERTIELCSSVIKNNGFSASDLDKIVLIGGPSKMPLIRQAVPASLGIPADLVTDPMTAVANGAAIYAESRSWDNGVTQRKSSRASETTRGDIVVKYDFPARTADDKATLRAKVESLDVTGWRIRVDGFDGWSSGEQALKENNRIDLPLPQPGDNRFWVILTGPKNQTQKSELVLTRTFASSAGVPATLTVCVAVEQDIGGSRREVLHPLVKKGTLLPNSGIEIFRAARAIVGGTEDHIDIKVYQAPEDVTDPNLSLLVGAFRIDANVDLQTGETIRQGQTIEVHWSMDDSGLLKAKIEIPDHSVSFDMGKFYSPKVGHKNFSGDEGKELAEGLVRDAGKAVDEIGVALGEFAWAEVSKLRGRVERQAQAIHQSSDPDARRQAAEESLLIRQEIARLRSAPTNQNLVINRELAKVESLYEDFESFIKEASTKDRVAQLSATARRFLDAGNHQQAESCVNQIRSLVLAELLRLPRFMVAQFEVLSEDRFLAVDKSLHDRLVSLGRDSIGTENWEGLRRINAELAENRFAAAAVEPLTTRLVGLVRS